MVFYLLMILLAIPVGLIIARLANDELIEGYNYINGLFFISFILFVIFSFYNEVIALSLGFISIVSYISVLKRFDSRWTVERKR